MLQKIARDITFILIENKVIGSNDRDIYLYGFEIILSTSIVTGTLLILGMLLHKIFLTLVYILIFTTLRTYTGGYHSNTFKSCFTISITIYLSELLLNSVLPRNLKLELGVISIVIAAIIIYRLSPVQHKNNPLLPEEREKYKKISRSIILAILVLTLFGFCINTGLIDYYFMISLTVVAVAILILIPFMGGGFQDE